MIIQKFGPNEITNDKLLSIIKYLLNKYFIIKF